MPRPVVGPGGLGRSWRKGRRTPGGGVSTHQEKSDSHHNVTVQGIQLTLEQRKFELHESNCIRMLFSLACSV